MGVVSPLIRLLVHAAETLPITTALLTEFPELDLLTPETTTDQRDAILQQLMERLDAKSKG
jgi:hypothetical protein